MCGKLLQLRKINLENPYDLTNKKVIHIISDVETLMFAYELIKSKPGNMTPGSDETTLDGITLHWIQNLSKDLRAGRFNFSPARRIGIPKPGKSELKFLSIVNPRDKIVQKAIQLVLEAIFEPSFLENSHGFRPQKGTHTALKTIKYWFHGVTWAIKADITKCFDSINHKVLLNCIQEKVECEKTIALIKKALQAGYIENERFHRSTIGTPQGSVLSPLLCNILMHKFDKFMWNIKTNFDQGRGRRKNAEFRKIQFEIEKSTTNQKKSVLRRTLWKLNSKDPMDPNFKRLFYIRYADDFLVGISGTHQDTVIVKNQISNFLKGISLTLNEEKTQIINLNKQSAFFLGTKISKKIADQKKIQLITKNGQTYKVRITPRISLHAPIKKLFEKAIAGGFVKSTPNQKRIYTPTALRRLVNLDHADIVKYYNYVIRGILNYYSFADNHKSLGSLVHTLKFSCARTLALKYKLRHASKVFKKYGKNLRYPNTDTLLYIPSTFARTSHFTCNPPKGEDFLSISWSNKLTKSNLDKTCVVCGATPVEMHHVRQLKDMKAKYKKGKIDFITLQMIALNRNQIPLCAKHHKEVHKLKSEKTTK